MLDPKRNYLTMIREEAQPENVRSDNGSEFIAETVQEFMAANGIKAITIDPGSPWQNGVIESYNSCFRREFADRWWFHNYDDIAVAMGDWLWDYNRYPPMAPSAASPQTNSRAGHRASDPVS